MHLKLIIALGLAMARSAQAYFPLNTDDASTQGKGAWQAEVYFEWLRDDTEAGRSRESTKELALSYGIRDDLDVGIGVGYSRQRGAEQVSEMSDSELVLKWRFNQTQRWSLAFSSALIVPTGKEDRGLGSGRLGLALNTIASVALSDAWNAYGNLAMNYSDLKSGEESAAKRATVWRVSAALDKRLTDSCLLAMEGGIAQAEEKVDDRYPAFGMFAFVYSPSSRIDLSVGYRFALNEPEDARSVLVGLTAHW